MRISEGSNTRTGQQPSAGADPTATSTAPSVSTVNGVRGGTYTTRPICSNTELRDTS